MNVLRRISENLAGKVVAAALAKERPAVLRAVGKVLAEGEAPLKVAWQQVPPLVLRACVLRAGYADDAVSELLAGAWLRHNAPLRAAVAQALLTQGYTVPDAGPATGPAHRLRPADVRSVPHADEPDRQHHYFYPAGQPLPGTAPDEAVTLMAYLLGWSVLDETDEAPPLPGDDDPALLALDSQFKQGLLSEAEIEAIPPRESALLVARSRQKALRSLQTVIAAHHAGTFRPEVYSVEEATALLAGMEEAVAELADDLTAAAEQLRRGELPANLAAATDDLLYLHTQYDAWTILLGSYLGPVTLPPAEGRTVAALYTLAAAAREAGDGATVRENALTQLARLARLQHRSSPDFAPLATVREQVQTLVTEITEAAPEALPASARALQAGTHPLALLLHLVADAEALEQVDEQSDAFLALEEALPRALVTALLLRKLVLAADSDAPAATAANPSAAEAAHSPTAPIPAAAAAPAEKMPVAPASATTADLGAAAGLAEAAAEDAVADTSAAAAAAVWLPAAQWQLLAEPRLALAWHLTSAAGPGVGLPARLLHALLLAPALQHADGALARALAPDFQVPLLAAGAHPLATRLLEVAAALRPALLAPTTGAAAWLAPACPGLPALGALTQLVAKREADAPLRPELGFSPPTQGTWQVRMASLRAALAAWEAEARTAQYRQQAGHPATRWWQHSLQPDQAADQLLGYLQARGPAGPLLAAVQAAREALQVETAPVEFELSAGHPALAWLHERQASLLELADRWSYLRVIQPGRGSLSQREAQDKAFCHKLATALAPARQELAALWPVADAQLQAALPWVEAALAQLHALLHRAAPDNPEPTPTALLHAPLLPYADLPLDLQGQLPAPASNWLLALHTAAAAPEPTWTEAFGAHLGRGQHRATAQILSLPGAGIGADGEALALLREARADALQHQRQAFAERVDRVREAVEQATRRGWLPEAERTELLLRHAYLRQQRDAVEPDYTALHRELDATEATLAAAEANAGGLTAPGFGPTKTAFSLFFPDHLRRLEQELESHPLPELLGRLTQGGTVGGTALLPASADDRAAASAALGAWEELRAERTVRGAQAPAEVELLLAFVGFGQPHLEPLAPGAPGSERADLRAGLVADAARCPVPAYGSAAAGRYRLVFVWRKVAEAGQLLDEAFAGAEEAGPSRPVIVLYFNSLTEPQRHDLLAAGRARRQTVLVLDRTLLLYLATVGLLHPDRLPLFFQLALPFAWLAPFPADAPELFVGRQTELDLLHSPSIESPKIVLGGPSSGKTALLNRLVALHHQPAEGQLVLLVNVARLGGPPERLLPALEQEVKRLLLSHGALPAGMGASLTFPKVLRHVRTWLRTQPERRLLLLLDDAREFVVQDQAQQSRIMLPVSELMGESNGPFKLVVACRDWVGPIRQEADVLRLGPLRRPTDAGAAETLLRRPLESLGAVFDDEQDVSRILVGTGYYPHLLQGMGGGLLELLADQPAPAAGERPAYRLGPADVSTVLAGMNAALAAFLQPVLVNGPHQHLLLLLLAVPDVAEQYAGTAGAGLQSAELARAGRRYWPIGFVGPAARVEAECVYELSGMVEAGLVLRSATGRYFLAEAGWAQPGSIEEMQAELAAFNATHPVNPDDAFAPRGPVAAPAPKVSMLKRLTNGRRSL